MLKIGGIILYSLLLVMGIMFYLTPDSIEKYLEVAKVFLKKILKVRLNNKDNFLDLMLMI